MNRLPPILLSAFFTVLATQAPASSDPDDPSPTASPTGGATTHGDGMGTWGESTSPGADEDGSSGEDGTVNVSTAQLPPGQWVTSDACSTVAASGCVQTYVCPDGSSPVVWIYVLDSGGSTSTYTQCPSDPEPTAGTPPVDIPGEVLTQFKAVPLPESVISIQPPGGRTLVNLPTIVSTKAAPFVREVRLNKVDVAVTLSITPVQFRWQLGDGASVATTEPGGAFLEEGPDSTPVCAVGERVVDCITHTYVRTVKDLAVSVDTTWAATYKVNGTGPWRDVSETVTITGASVGLDVLEARPQLVR